MVTYNASDYFPPKIGLLWNLLSLNFSNVIMLKIFLLFGVCMDGDNRLSLKVKQKKKPPLKMLTCTTSSQPSKVVVLSLMHLTGSGEKNSSRLSFSHDNIPPDHELLKTLILRIAWRHILNLYSLAFVSFLNKSEELIGQSWKSTVCDIRPLLALIIVWQPHLLSSWAVLTGSSYFSKLLFIPSDYLKYFQAMVYGFGLYSLAWFMVVKMPCSSIMV